jgi:Flp pilus assembly protein TadD
MPSRCAKFAIVLALVTLAACGSSPRAPEKSASASSKNNAPTATAPQEQGSVAQPSSASTQPANAPAQPANSGKGAKGDAKSSPPVAAAAQPVEPAPLPPEAVQRFDRAVAMMVSNATQAEREFASLSDAYPQYSGAKVNLGILQAKAGRLEDAQKSLSNAVQRNPTNAVAFNELGIVYRKLGRFKEAEQAYSAAIKADPNYANAYLNLGVLCDLYLLDSTRALEAYEHYLMVATKPVPQVEAWVKELKSRAGSQDRSASTG